jgi:hypothetical protein
MISEKALNKRESCMFTFNCNFLDRVLDWLEKDDSDLEKFISCSICLMVVTYFLARTLQSI